MYEVQHVTSDRLPDGIYQQMASFVRLVWLNQLKDDDRFWRLADPTGHIDHFYIAERDVLISHACVNQRTINHAGVTYSVRGLGAVFTYPAFRGEGHASRVVAAATEFVRNTDADLGMLFTDPGLARFYETHGWSALSPAPSIAYGDPAHPKLDEGAFNMAIFLSSKARTRRDDFTYGPIYVGEFTW